jgi:transporter family protein
MKETSLSDRQRWRHLGVHYWVAASLGFALMVGASGITIKLALQSVTWPTLIVPTLIAYAILLIYFAATGGVSMPTTPGTWVLWVALTGAFTAGAFPLINLALMRAPASQVIPISAVYPVVTALLAAAFLGERITVPRGLGILLVVGGAYLVSR